MAGTTDESNPFVEWLLGQLQERGWTREELARRSDTASSVISSVINRKVALGPDVARRIASALGVSQFDVFRLAGLIDEELLNDDEAAKEYLRLLAAIEDDDDREEAIELVEGILRQVAERRKTYRYQGPNHSRAGRRPAPGRPAADG